MARWGRDVHRTRIVAACLATALSVVVVATLSGCSGSSTSMTLPIAKRDTLTLETQIAAFVPVEYVSRTQQTTTSKVIFPCLGHDNESYWPGTTSLTLRDGIDTAAVLKGIETKWGGKHGWKVSRTIDSDGSPSLTITSTDGPRFTAQFVQGPQFTISALSACFPMAGLGGMSTY
jgi:hypothetical protein